MSPLPSLRRAKVHLDAMRVVAASRSPFALPHLFSSQRSVLSASPPIHVGLVFLRDLHRDPAVDVEPAQIFAEPKMLKVEFDELGSSWIYSYSQWYAGSSSASIILTANYWNSLIDALEIDVRVLPAFPTPGDGTLDCQVDLRDLVFVRNRLGLDADAGDNWRADVNRDGAIDNADLIYVRNRLGTTCQDGD